MPIITHPDTGGRYDATDEQVKGFARAGWVVDDDQSPIEAPDDDTPIAVSLDLDDEHDDETTDPDEPAATATETTEQE